MNILIIIAIYISGWFAARWLNKKIDKRDPRVTFWFFSWLFVLIVGTMYVAYLIDEYKWPDWIKGKGWE